MTRFTLIIITAMLALSCKPKQDDKSTLIDSAKSHTDYIDTTKVEPAKSKIESFNQVAKTIDKLSAIGIGKMSEWKQVDNTYTSSTPPFAMGDKKLNTVAYVIESYDINYINSLSIVLSIGDPKESRQALAKLKEVTTKAFETLEIQMPTPLPNAILNTKELIVDGIDYGTSVKTDSTNTPSWTVRVTTRTTN